MRLGLGRLVPKESADTLKLSGRMRHAVARWRLTLVGTPMLTIAAAVFDGRVAYVVGVAAVSAVALMYADTVVARLVGQGHTGDDDSRTG